MGVHKSDSKTRKSLRENQCVTSSNAKDHKFLHFYLYRRIYVGLIIDTNYFHAQTQDQFRDSFLTNFKNFIIKRILYYRKKMFYLPILVLLVLYQFLLN